MRRHRDGRFGLALGVLLLVQAPPHYAHAAAAPMLVPGGSNEVTVAALELDDRALLDSFPRKRFIAADNSMYRPILETGRVTGVFRE